MLSFYVCQKEIIKYSCIRSPCSNIDINKVILESIDKDIDKRNLKNIDIERGILTNINIDKKLY